MPHVNEQLLDHAIKTGDFRYLSDWAEENELPVLAKVLNGHYKNKQIPAMPDYLPHENGLTPRESYEHIKKSPELVPGVHMVPGHDVVPGNKTIGYWLHDLRGFEYPKEDEGMLENGLDDEDHADRMERLREELESNTPSHYFHSSNRKNYGTEDSPQYIQKRDKLELAKPIPVYEDPGDEVHITGLSKGGNCEHCGKPDIYRIHVKHSTNGTECKIGSTCASGMLRDMSKKNLSGKMTTKDVLRKAATAESLKDVGSVVKVRLKNKDTKLAKDTKENLARGRIRVALARGTSVSPDYHTTEEVYAALVAEGIEPAKAQEMANALS